MINKHNMDRKINNCEEIPIGTCAARGYSYYTTGHHALGRGSGSGDGWCMPKGKGCGDGGEYGACSTKGLGTG